jgi:hypothetical protein
MNILSRERQIEIIAALCEGVGQRAVTRLTGTDRKTVARLALRVGRGCVKLHDRLMVGIRVNRLELDEAWSFVGKKRCGGRAVRGALQSVPRPRSPQDDASEGAGRCGPDLGHRRAYRCCAGYAAHYAGPDRAGTAPRFPCNSGRTQLEGLSSPVMSAIIDSL